MPRGSHVRGASWKFTQPNMWRAEKRAKDSWSSAFIGGGQGGGVRVEYTRKV